MGNVVIHNKKNDSPFEVRYPLTVSVTLTQVTATFDVAGYEDKAEICGCFMLANTNSDAYQPLILVFGCAFDSGHAYNKTRSIDQAIWASSYKTNNSTLNGRDYTSPTIAITGSTLSVTMNIPSAVNKTQAGILMNACITVYK